MKKTNRDLLERQLYRLEHEVSDDFHLLQEGGVGYFSTEELRDLLLSWRLRYQSFERLHYLFIGFGCAAPLMFLLALGIQRMGFLTYSLKVFWLSPICLSIFFVGQFWLRKKYTNRETIESYGKMIQEELVNRRKQRDTSFF